MYVFLYSFNLFVIENVINRRKNKEIQNDLTERGVETSPEHNLYGNLGLRAIMKII